MDALPCPPSSPLPHFDQNLTLTPFSLCVLRYHTSEPPGFVIQKSWLQPWRLHISSFLIKSKQPLRELPPHHHRGQVASSIRALVMLASLLVSSFLRRVNGAKRLPHKLKTWLNSKHNSTKVQWQRHHTPTSAHNRVLYCFNTPSAP